MKLIKLTCPFCNANLELEQERKSYYCSYCGKKILLDDEVTRYEFISIDESRIAEANAEEAIRLKELQLEEKKMKYHIILVLAWAFSLLIAFIVAFIGAKRTGNIVGGASWPLLIDLYIGVFLFLKRPQ